MAAMPFVRGPTSIVRSRAPGAPVKAMPIIGSGPCQPCGVAGERRKPRRSSVSERRSSARRALRSSPARPTASTTIGERPSTPETSVAGASSAFGREGCLVERRADEGVDAPAAERIVLRERGGEAAADGAGIGARDDEVCDGEPPLAGERADELGHVAPDAAEVEGPREASLDGELGIDGREREIRQRRLADHRGALGGGAAEDEVGGDAPVGERAFEPGQGEPVAGDHEVEAGVPRDEAAPERQRADRDRGRAALDRPAQRREGLARPRPRALSQHVAERQRLREPGQGQRLEPDLARGIAAQRPAHVGPDGLPRQRAAGLQPRLQPLARERHAQVGRRRRVRDGTAAAMSRAMAGGAGAGRQVR